MNEIKNFITKAQIALKSQKNRELRGQKTAI
jgi:hypothetical protein